MPNMLKVRLTLDVTYKNEENPDVKPEFSEIESQLKQLVQYAMETGMLSDNMDYVVEDFDSRVEVLELGTSL
jgi:hypothetical protein